MADEIHCTDFKGFPPVPEESRLTAEGAAVGPFGFLERLAYIDLISYFANEPSEDLLPIPTTPGINAEEVDMCNGLSVWSDETSEGWIATSSGKPLKSNRFSLEEWGSWRLAFLLAWLQRAVWCHEIAELDDHLLGYHISHRQPEPAKDKAQRKRGRPRWNSATLESLPESNPRRRRESQVKPYLEEKAPLLACERASERRKRKRALKEAPEISSEPGTPEECVLDAAEPEPDQEQYAIVLDFPPDPNDSRFTVEGAVLGDNGKIKVSAYKDQELMDIFANEPPIQQHPDPQRPGLRLSELEDAYIYEIQNSLRSWNDKKGRGWIARRQRPGGKTESAWISAANLGSWRLALLLARLQIMVWQEDDCTQGDLVPLARAPGPVACSASKKLPPRAKVPRKKKQTSPECLLDIDEVIDEATARLQIENEVSSAQLEKDVPLLPLADRSPESSRCRVSKHRSRRKSDEFGDEFIESPSAQDSLPVARKAICSEVFQRNIEEQQRDNLAQDTRVYPVWGRGALKLNSNHAAPRRNLHQLGAPARGPRTEEEVQAAIAQLLMVSEVL